MNLPPALLISLFEKVSNNYRSRYLKLRVDEVELVGVGFVKLLCKLHENSLKICKKDIFYTIALAYTHFCGFGTKKYVVIFNKFVKV